MIRRMRKVNSRSTQSTFARTHLSNKISKIKSFSRIEEERKANRGELSPSKPGFFSLPALSPLVSISSLHSPQLSSVSSPSSPFLVSPPLSPLRISSTEQFRTFDDIVSTPSLTENESRMIDDQERTDSTIRNLNDSDIESISSWLMNLANDETIPQISFNSTILEQYPLQASLESVRQYAHRSIYPRPLYFVRKENLDELCKIRRQKDNNCDKDISSESEPENLDDKRISNLCNERNDSETLFTNDKTSNSNEKNKDFELSEKDLSHIENQEQHLYEGGANYYPTQNYPSACVSASIQYPVCTSQTSSLVSEMDIERSVDMQEFNRDLSINSNHLSHTKQYSKQSILNDKQNSFQCFSLREKNSFLMRIITESEKENSELINAYENQLMLVNDFNALRTRIGGAVIMNATFIDVEDCCKTNEAEKESVNEKSVVKEQKCYQEKKRKPGRPRKARSMLVHKPNKKNNTQEPSSAMKKRTYVKRRKTSDIYNETKLSKVSTRLKTRECEIENQDLELQQDGAYTDDTTSSETSSIHRSHFGKEKNKDSSIITSSSFNDSNERSKIQRITKQLRNQKKTKKSVKDLDKKCEKSNKRINEIRIQDENNSEISSSDEISEQSDEMVMWSEVESDYQNSSVYHKRNDEKKSESFSSENENKQKRRKKSRNEKRRCKLKRKTVLHTEENLSLLRKKLQESSKIPYSIVDQITTDEKFRLCESKKVLYNNVENEEFKPIEMVAEKSKNPMCKQPRYVYDSPSRLSNILRSYGKKTINKYMKRGVPACGDTIKTHEWVSEMYCLLCRTLKKKPWPLQPELTYGFLKLLGIGCRYSMKSLKSSIIPSLYSLSQTNTKLPVDIEVRQAVMQANREIQTAHMKMFNLNIKTRGGANMLVSKEKEPLIVGDLERIISSIPDWVVEKPREASLFIFALSTGSRSITCANIKLRDIVRVYAKENSSFLKITFNLVCGKNIRMDDHCVTLEGDICSKSSLNFIWWFEQYLVQEFGLSLTRFDEWNLKDLGWERVWGLRKGAMRVRIQKRAKQAGYPEKLFGFHSFRSGFLCSALLKIGDSPYKRESVLETASIIAKWKFGGPTEEKYLNRTSKATIIANRTNFPSDVLESDNPYDFDLSKPEVFHNMKINQSEWKIDSIIVTLRFYILQVIKFACWKLGYPSSYVSKLHSMAATKFMKEHDIKRKKTQTTIQACKEYVLQLVKTSGGDLIDIANEFLSQIDDYLDGKIILDVKDFEPRKKLREERTINPITNCKSRIHWTRMEDDILIKELMDGKSFADIGEKLKIRSANSCRDRVRNIIKQLTNEKAKESSGILMNLRRNTSRSKQ